MKLKFEAHDKAFICEVFGMSETLFTSVTKSMAEYFSKQQQADNKTLTKTMMFESYLNSQEFKDVNLPLTDANTFFLLGYMFRGALELTKPKMSEFVEFLHSMAHDHGEEQEHTEKKDGKEERLPN